MSPNSDRRAQAFLPDFCRCRHAGPQYQRSRVPAWLHPRAKVKISCTSSGTMRKTYCSCRRTQTEYQKTKAFQRLGPEVEFNSTYA
jgi:hypothetical protein